MIKDVLKKLKYIIEGQRDPYQIDYHCSRLYKKEDKQMIKDEIKEILKADVEKVDIHFDFNDSAKAKVNIQFKGIPNQFEYEDTNVNSIRINEIYTQLEELGSALVGKINKLAQAHGLVWSYKDWLKDDLKAIEDANKELYIRFNGKVVGKYIKLNTDIDGYKISNCIKIKSGYEWVLLNRPARISITNKYGGISEYVSLDKPVRIFITNKYGEIYKDIYGYLTEIRKQDNNKLLVTIEQEFICTEA